MVNPNQPTLRSTDPVLIEYRKSAIIGDFIEGIIDVIEKRGIKRKELADAIGVSTSYVSQVLTFRKVPSVEFIAKLLVVLHLEFKIDILERPNT